ncbi:MAG: YraN family protein [bacterium]|nr:YraN family protein [bacterium]MDA1024725.1 YraN family protein [bacterium]
MHLRRKRGNEGERLAEQYLKKKRYTLLARQFFARSGEIDLIMQHASEIVFVEVKTRMTNAFGYPEESVTKAKIKKMYRAAEIYLRKHPTNLQPRFDLIAITLEGENGPDVRHFENIGEG